MKNAKLLIVILIAVAAAGAGALLMMKKKQAAENAGGAAPAETLNDAFKESAPLTEKPAVDPTASAAPKPEETPAQPALDNKAFFKAPEGQAPAAAPTEGQAAPAVAPTEGQAAPAAAPTEGQTAPAAAPTEGQTAPAEGQAPAQPH